MILAIRNFILCSFAFVTMANAASSELDQKEVTVFIQRMYSYESGVFELGEFNGKINSSRQCTLIEEFFKKELISHPQMSNLCGTGNVYIRYPSLHDEEFEYSDNPWKGIKPKFCKPIVQGEKASVAVTSKYGRTVFFLTKTDKGLRVENALYYLSWPPDSEVCTSSFLAKPTPWQKKAEQPVCNR